MNPTPLPPAAPAPSPWRWAGLGVLLFGLLHASTGIESAGGLGYVLSALLGAVWALLLQVRERLALVEARLLAAEHALQHGVGVAVVLPPAPASTHAPEPESAPEPEATTNTTWGAAEPATPAPAEPVRAFTPAPIAADPTPLERAWEWLRTGNPLAKVGVVILFFGAVFLIKYAADQRLFPLELRFAALAAGATGLLALGWRWRQHRPGYAQVLQGGGVAGLYLVSFAAAKFYALLPLPLALGVMVLVAALAAGLAVAQSSLALAVIGTTGGFAAPLLLATGSGNSVALFSYYTVLNLGVFAVAWFRAWRVLNLIGLFFTFGVAGAFRGFSYQDHQRLSTDAFVLLFFLLYVAVSVLFALRQKPQLKGAVSASLVFGLPVAAFGLHVSLWQGVEYAAAWSALGFGLFYLALARLLWHRAPDTLRLLAQAFVALGVIFLSLAVPLAFDEEATALTWAVEGAGLVWLGVRQQQRLSRAFGLLLQVGALVAFAGQGAVALGAAPLANPQFLGLFALGLAALASGVWLRQLPVAVGAAGAALSHRLAPLMVVYGTGAWVLALLAEVQRTAPEQAVGLTLAALSALALGWQALSYRLRWPLWDALAVALMALAAALAVAATAGEGDGPLPPSALAGALGWPLWLAAQGWQLWRREPAGAGLGLQHALTGLLAVWLLSWQCTWWAQQTLPPGIWVALPAAAVLALALSILARQPLQPAWPLAAHASAYRYGVGGVLAGFAVLWLVAHNLMGNGSAAPLATWPLLNPLDIASAVLLLVLARTAASVRAAVPPLLPWVLGAALVFLWLNSALVRGLHYSVGTPLLGQGAMQSTVLQAAFSVFWSLLAFAAMLVAARRGQRLAWLAGAGLMAVVVIKLFVVDTANTGTLARIVAFFAVGGVLLVTGYLAPLPPAPATAADDPSPSDPAR